MSSGHPSDRNLLAGTYRILEKINDTGRRFKAFDVLQRRIVALEILPPSSATDPSERPALEREIQAACRLRHPNIAAALAVAEEHGTRFLVVEYVEGSDLRRIVRDRGPLSLGQAIDLLIQAARGLEAAHAIGIVHHNLEPANLMLDAAGTVRILRLGLAVDMAPERAADSRPADPRCDVYSLGCILYFVLTGREPFVGDTVIERSTADREQPAPVLRVLRPDAPTALEEVYQKMTARRPDDRPASMTEVIGLLESCRSPVAGSASSRRAAPRDRSRQAAGGAGRPKKGTNSSQAGRNVPSFAREENADGRPIGPEFSLEGLGMDVPSQAARARSSGPSIEIPNADSKRTATANPPNPFRAARPAIVLGLAAITAIAVVVVRFAYHSGQNGSRTAAPPQSAGDPAAIATTRFVDGSTEVNPRYPLEPEWISRTIFDGTSPGRWMLTNRRPLARKHVQTDGLNPHGTGSYLVVYEQKVGDFILDFDYKLSKGCNSGVFLRVGDLDDPVNTGIEVALDDTAGSADEDSGAIYGLVAPSKNAQGPAGEWNHMTITARGPSIAVALNGTGVSRIDLDDWTVPGKRPDGSDHKFKDAAFARIPRRGYIGFQDLIGDCWFKNITLKTPRG